MRTLFSTNSKLTGSYTVETACLTGLFLLVVFSSLFLILGTSLKGAGTMTALEAAEFGSMKAVRKNGNGISAASSRIQNQSLHYSVTGNNQETIVYFEDILTFPLPGLRWHIKGNAQIKVIRPVLFIEKVKQAIAIKNSLTAD
ncbi:MAG: hypothetical protein ACI4EO_03700 [Blautia sp.]